jgi:hypothetical protein
MPLLVVILLGLAKNLVDTSYHVSWVPTLPIKSSQVVDVFNSDEPMTTAAVSVYKHRAAINLEEQVSSQCTLMRCLAVLLTLIFFLAKYVIDFFRRPDTCVASCLFV